MKHCSQARLLLMGTGCESGCELEALTQAMAQQGRLFVPQVISDDPDR